MQTYAKISWGWHISTAYMKAIAAELKISPLPSKLLVERNITLSRVQGWQSLMNASRSH